MEFTVKRNALLGELNLVQGVIEKRSTIPILSNILLEAEGGHLGVTATDLDVSICCGCVADITVPGTTTVAARRFFDIVRLLPEESEIHCTLLENDWMQLKSGLSEFKVVGLPKENFPSIPQAAGPGVSIPGGVLRAMIQRTVFAITAEEESRYSLNGALLLLSPEIIRMVATDGHRLAVVSGSIEGLELDREIRALIPRKAVLEIQRLVGDQELLVEFCRDENHLFFCAGGKRLVSRMLAGQFPNYEMVVPRDNDKRITVGARALGEAIRRAAVMSDEKLRAIKILFGHGTAEVTASSAEAGEAHETVPIEYEGLEVQIGFNPQYLLEFLNVCGSDAVMIEVRDSETQGLFSPVGAAGLDYRYVVMPMKF
jgi:DNA polymerase-3 subunit beta